MTVRYLSKAQSDLLTIRTWGDARWGQARTDDFIRSLVDAIGRLQGLPQLGRSREALTAGARSIAHRGYVIVYKVEGDDILVGAILHERRNLSALDFADRLEGE